MMKEQPPVRDARFSPDARVMFIPVETPKGIMKGSYRVEFRSIKIHGDGRKTAKITIPCENTITGKKMKFVVVPEKKAGWSCRWAFRCEDEMLSMMWVYVKGRPRCQVTELQ